MRINPKSELGVDSIREGNSAEILKSCRQVSRWGERQEMVVFLTEWFTGGLPSRTGFFTSFFRSSMAQEACVPHGSAGIAEPPASAA